MEIVQVRDAAWIKHECSLYIHISLTSQTLETSAARLSVSSLTAHVGLSQEMDRKGYIRFSDTILRHLNLNNIALDWQEDE